MSSETNTPTPPLFSTETFDITYLTHNPAGYTFDTSASTSRTAELNGPLDLKPGEQTKFASGMQREAEFSGAGKLRELRNAYLHPESPITTEEATELRAKYDTARAAYAQRGKKLGLSAITLSGDNTLQANIKIVPFPVYRDFANYESGDDMRTLSRAAGVAMIVRTADNRLLIQHRAVETIKLHEPGKTPGNAAYADIPGASVAGMMDASLRGANRKPGTPDPVTDETIRSMALKEAGEELGLGPEDFTQLRIVGVANDKVKPHDELLLIADSTLDVAGVYKASKHSNKNKDLDPIDLEEKFFDIEASPQAIETLLCDVRCPLPSTHAAALVAAGYLMKIEQDGQENADAWRAGLQQRISANYEAIDKMVRDFYDANPAATHYVPERYWGKAVPARDASGYTPLYTPEEQGLPAFDDEMVRTGLLPETRTIVDTAYLFDVDGVITDPTDKQASSEVLAAVRTKLEAGMPVGFNTGRSAEWVVKNVIAPLRETTTNKNLLQNAIVIGEKGATWALFDEQGQPHYGKVESLAVPAELKAQVENLVANYSDSMANLDPKTTMFSVEMLDGHKLEDFHAKRAHFARELRALLHDSGDDNKFRVDETTIATDVESPHVGKALGAARFIDFLRLRNVKATNFVAFGDSPSDLAMAEELSRRKQNVTMVYVGDPAKLPHDEAAKYPILAEPGYRQATTDYLASN